MEEQIVLFEDDTIISDDKAIAESFNSHFLTITDSLDLDPTFKVLMHRKFRRHFLS